MDTKKQRQKPSSDIGYRRPRRRYRSLTGTLSFWLALASLVFLLVVGIALYAAFRSGTLDRGEITLAKTAILIAAIMAGIALLLAVATLFQRRRKKTLGAIGMVLSLLMLVVTVGVIYVYNYAFGSMREQDLSNDNLHIQQPEENGEIVRGDNVPDTTLSPEQIEESFGYSEIEWAHYGDPDIPELALQKLHTADPEGASYLLDGSEQVTNFLLFGLDEGLFGERASDTVILFSLDRVHHKLKMVSIARDSYVRIPAWGTYSKLTYAYSAGGPEWAVATVNRNYYLNVEDYVAVDVDQLEMIIDYIGGVDVELTSIEAQYLNGRGYYDLRPGKNHLDGETAVAYSRIRSSSADDNEEHRTGRQRTVLTAILNSVLDMPLTSYPGFIRSCLGMCTTSLAADELMELAAEVVQNNYTIEQTALISQVDYWDGVIGPEQYFYVVYDLNRASDKIYRFVYEDLYVSGYYD